jgi:hypothetical protein
MNRTKKQVEEKPSEEQQFWETDNVMDLQTLKKLIRQREIKEKLKVDVFLRDLVGKRLLLIGIEEADRGVILLFKQDPKSENTIRAYTNSRVIIKDLPMYKKMLSLTKGFYVNIMKKISKTGNEYITLS